jgi:hypothetical protein
VVINLLPPSLHRLLGLAALVTSMLVASPGAAARPSQSSIAPTDEGGLLLGGEGLFTPEPEAAIGLVDEAPASDPLDGVLGSVVGEPLSGGFSESIVSPEPSPMDGLLVDEMPEEVSSGGWFGTGQYYGSAELVFLNRGRNYRRVIGYDSKLLTVENDLVRYAILKSKQGVFTTDSLPYNVA